VTIRFPRFDQRDVRAQTAFQKVGLTIKFSRFFPLANNCSDAGWYKERRNACTAGTNALGEGALGNQRELQFSGDDKFLKQPVFSHVTSDVGRNHAGLKHQTHPESINTHVVTDGVQPFYIFANQGRNQVFRDSAQTKTAEHHCHAVP